MSTVKKAVDLFVEHGSQVAILHCNSAYPANDEELDLNVIKTLQQAFPDHVIGYSGHEYGISASLVAATLGARIIERHVTLDRAMWGTDQAASIEESGLKRLVRDLHKLPVWLGSSQLTVYETERKVMSKLRDKDTL